MFLKTKERRVFLALGPTDMRKSINTLSVLVEGEFGKNAFSGDLFVFCNRGQQIIKALYWDKNGFCLWQKRLEEHRFKWPKSTRELREIGLQELQWLLDGFDISLAFKPLQYQHVI